MEHPSSHTGSEADGAGASRLIVALMVGVALYASHGVAIVTVLPVIAGDLEGRALYGAAASVYLVSSIVGLAAAARPIATRGPLPVMQAGLAIFSVGLGLSAAAPDMTWLVLARAIEGLGGGVVATVIYASVNLAFPSAARARILALLSAAWIVPTLCAPPVAALVAESFGWRWVFLGLLPGVVFTWLCGFGPLLRIGASAPGAATGDSGTGRAIPLAIGCGALLAAGGVVGPGPWATGAALLLAILGGAVVVRSVDRVLPRGTLAARRGLPGAIALKTLLAMTYFGVECFLPLATTELLGWTPLEAGWLLSGAGVTWTLGSVAEARFGGRADGRGAVLGSAIVLAGVGAEVAALATGQASAGLYLAWWLAAFGMGVGYNVTNSTAMAETAAGHEGATSSALGISDSLGIALGAGLGGLLIATAEAFTWSLTRALDLQFALMIAVGLTATVLARRVLVGPPAVPLVVPDDAPSSP